MRSLFFIAYILLFVSVKSQTDSAKYAEAAVYALSPSDSVIYYQCRVQPADVTVKTSDGSFTAAQQTITVTEKFVVSKRDSLYLIRHYVSGFTAYPNRKFSGLKLRERDYWKFEFQNERALSSKEVLFLAALQQTGRPTTEYDFALTKYTTNQLIIKYRKRFEQLLPAGNVSVSKALGLTKD